MIPLALILTAVLSAGAVAWGCDPALAEWAGGVSIIRWMYRLQWVWIALAVVCSMSVVALVVTEKRRGWWLLGLLPVIGIFAWRFGISPTRPGAVDDQPTFVRISQAGWMNDGDRVIGVLADGESYAFPLAAMVRVPVMVITDRDRRLVVCWSQQSNIATAYWSDRSVRGRDLSIVTSPGGVLLICNTRIGEFFDALTLRQANGAAMTGFAGRVPVEQGTWAAWKSAHPETMILQPKWEMAAAESIPVAPPVDETVIYVATDPPILLPSAELGITPANAANGKSTALILREGGLGKVIALDRRIDGDLFPQFKLNSDTKLKRVAMIDSDTGSGWTFAGECIEGPMKGTRLKPLIAIENVPAVTARFWLRQK